MASCQARGGAPADVSHRSLDVSHRRRLTPAVHQAGHAVMLRSKGSACTPGARGRGHTLRASHALRAQQPRALQPAEATADRGREGNLARLRPSLARSPPPPPHRGLRGRVQATPCGPCQDRRSHHARECSSELLPAWDQGGLSASYCHGHAARAAGRPGIVESSLSVAERRS